MITSVSDIKAIVDRIYNKSIVSWSRSWYSKRDISTNVYRRKSLTKQQKAEIVNYWNNYCHLTKTSWKFFEFYNYLCEEKSLLKYYIPEDIYYSKIDTYFSDVKACYAIDDKNMYDLYFPEVKRPLTVVRKMGGVFLNENYEKIDFDSAKSLICNKEGGVIVKVSKNSMSGNGISFFDSQTSDIAVLDDILLKNDNLIVQEVLKQHSTLATIHAQSVNTIRIMTCVMNGNVNVVSAVLRMGTGAARVDNAHSGGIAIGINDDGTLKTFARNLYGDKFECHPSGVSFSNVLIPSFNEMKNTAKLLTFRLGANTKLVSWDFSVDMNGNPVLIEANMTYGGVDVHQLTNGPIFGEKTTKVLNEVFGIA